MKRKLSDIEKKEYSYFIRVLSSAVNATEPPLPYSGIDWNTLLKRAQYCGLGFAFSSVVLRLPKQYFPNDTVIKVLKENINFGIMIDSNLNYEIEKVLSAFEKHKIKNVPVKGYFLKKEYPRPECRTVGDFDILFDINQVDSVKQAFSEIGYEFTFNDDNQYHFRKLPYVFIEMHSSLVHEWESYYPYLCDSLDRSVKREGYDYSYELSPEDHYIYLLVHNSNHFRMGGLSIRMVLDTYVYYKNHKSDFDFDYLNERLKLFKLDVFEKRIREIAFNWFSPDKQKITFDDLEIYIILSAVLGRVDAGVMIKSYKNILEAEKAGKNKSKFSYFLSSVFPRKSEMLPHYPYLERLPFLLPASWASMWFKRLFIDKNVHFKRGLKNRFSYTQEDIEYFKNILNETGFDDLN